MVGFDKSDQMRKIRRKVDKPNIEKGFSNDISPKSFLNKYKISLLNQLSVIGLSTFPLIFLMICYIYESIDNYTISMYKSYKIEFMFIQMLLIPKY